MTAQPTRVVDAHVHLWDPARTDWYPYLSHPQAQGDGDASRMFRRFDVDMYRSEAARWNVEKFINVAAATGRHSIEETVELDANAPVRGGPDAVIGGLPPTDTVAEAVELLDPQMAASRFRGVRPTGASMGPVPDPGVLHALRERNLLFELMSHPDQLGVAATQLVGFDDLIVVVEHTGWPRSNSDEERALWRAGIDARRPIWATTSCASSRAWRCRSGPWASTPCPLARIRHRGPWRRPLHVRQQLPGGRDVRNLRRALHHVQCRDRRPRRRFPRQALCRERRARLPLLGPPARVLGHLNGDLERSRPASGSDRPQG